MKIDHSPGLTHRTKLEPPKSATSLSTNPALQKQALSIRQPIDPAHIPSVSSDMVRRTIPEGVLDGSGIPANTTVYLAFFPDSRNGLSQHYCLSNSPALKALQQVGEASATLLSNLTNRTIEFITDATRLSADQTRNTIFIQMVPRRLDGVIGIHYYNNLGLGTISLIEGMTNTTMIEVLIHEFLHQFGGQTIS